jgi:hypothetical protein
MSPHQHKQKQQMQQQESQSKQAYPSDRMILAMLEGLTNKIDYVSIHDMTSICPKN